MKIVTWNCNRAFRTKHHKLNRFEADLLVIQECENPKKEGSQYREYREWAGRYLWHGTNDNMGLGVFARNDTIIERLDWPDNGFKDFLPCRVNDSVNLVAVWTKPGKSHSYIGQLWQYLQIHKQKLATTDTVICGDFNSNVAWDKPSRNWNHSDVVQILRKINIHSHYHHLQKVEHGEENHPTLYLQKNAEKPYHVDYAFTSASLFPTSLDVQLGHPDDWLKFSDHFPISFSISTEP